VNRNKLTEKHSFLNDSIFRFKSILLIGNRFVKNIRSTLQYFTNSKQLLNDPVISFSESDLWNLSDNPDNWILTAGKVENLRIAIRRLNGLEIKANKIFSFWKHIGNPNFGKGYVIGREIREGCIVPTIAGGLCQLSNALYDAALKANFDIVERHKHTKVIQGSLAEQDRDATVKWNYVDLRFKSTTDFRIEIELTSDKLIIRLRGKQKSNTSQIQALYYQSSNKLNDCYSCGNFTCFKHPVESITKQERPLTTFIVDEKWPEFDQYVHSISTPSDYYIVPLKTNKYLWKSSTKNKTKSTMKSGILRALTLRFFARNKNVFELNMSFDKKIATAAARHIPVASTHLVISQNLLPFIYETGALGGRTFDVLMTRLPMEKLQERLDFAHSKHKESLTLRDYRVSQTVVNMENAALTKARKIITTHAEIAAIFKNKVEKLNWNFPSIKQEAVEGSKILFPASALARKGAYEIRQLAKELNLKVAIAGKAIEAINF